MVEYSNKNVQTKNKKIKLALSFSAADTERQTARASVRQEGEICLKCTDIWFLK